MSFINLNNDRRLILLVITIACFAILCSCDWGRKEDPEIVIRGAVFDSSSNISIENVWYDFGDTLEPYYGVTDTTGEFIIGVLGYPPKSVFLYFTIDDYIPFDTVIQVPEGVFLIDDVEIYLERM